MSGLAEILEENALLREKMASLREALADTQNELTDTQNKLTDTQDQLEVRTLERDAVIAEAERLARVLELIRLEAAGPKSQRFVPEGQTELFAGPVPPPPRAPVPEPPSDDEETITARKRRGGKKSRRRTSHDFADLPSREVRCEVGADATCAGCGGQMNVFAEVRSFRIEWVIGHFERHDIVREKCACPDCPGQGVLTAPGPYGLDRCMAANGLLARVVCDKFADHIPANRQARRMAREGFEVGSNTVSSWLCKTGAHLEPLADAVRAEVLAGEAVQGDDTGMPVQDGGNGALRKGRMWAFTDQDQVFYAFTDTKEGKFPNELLRGYMGRLLLVDGGSEFNEVVRHRGLTRSGCWSHLRTYFFKALPDHPVEAELALGTLRDLFKVERDVWGNPADEVLAERQARSRPLVDGFYAWVRGMSKLARPRSTLAKAFTYALNQEAEMRRFLDHGELPMHNNLSELMLRQTVVGRKNWLFARSEGGAAAAATLYTLIGSCSLQGIDPQTYIKDVLGRVMDYPASRLSELTPRGWRLSRSGSGAG